MYVCLFTVYLQHYFASVQWSDNHILYKVFPSTPECAPCRLVSEAKRGLAWLVLGGEAKSNFSRVLEEEGKHLD